MITTTTSLARRVVHPRRDMRLLADWEPVTTRLGLALAALLPVLMLAGAMDDRAIAGVAVWAKPVKFALAFSIYLLTLGFFGRFVDRAWRGRIAFKALLLAGAAAIVMEQAIMTLQSARGVGSHFNVATPLDAGLYAAMGVGSLVLTVMTLPVAWGVGKWSVVNEVQKEDLLHRGAEGRDVGSVGEWRVPPSNRAAVRPIAFSSSSDPF